MIDLFFPVKPPEREASLIHRMVDDAPEPRKELVTTPRQRANMKAYYKLNRESALKRAREWALANPERRKKHSRDSAARLRKRNDVQV